MSVMVLVLAVVMLLMVLWMARDVQHHESVIEELLARAERQYLISSSLSSSYYLKVAALSTQHTDRHTSSYTEGYAKGRESVVDEDSRTWI
jgi:NADH:ubiquinone oxidoreductase subunit 6 (subunit J)